MSRNIQVHSVKSPLQSRSQDTLDRIAQAGRDLLESKDWDEISVDELVRRAQSSVGSFYARFKDKDGLLDYLDATHTQEIIESFKPLLSNEGDTEMDLENLIRKLMSSLAVYHRSQRGLVRALLSPTNSKRRPTSSSTIGSLRSTLLKILTILDRKRYAMNHPNPRRGIALGLSFALSAMRDQILSPDLTLNEETVSEKELVEELSLLMLSYLGVRSRRR